MASVRRMIPATSRRTLPRPVTVLVAVLAVGAVATGCTGGPASTDVADVNGARLGADGFEKLMDEFVAEDVYTATDGRISGDDARELLGYVVQAELASQFLDARGVPLTDARIDAATDANIAQAPDRMRSLLARLRAADTALGELGAPSASELEALYLADPATVGSVCARHILVDTESEARTVLRELADGAAFADVAARRSVDTATAADGGALEGPTGPCIDISTLYDQQFDADFLAAAFDARAGVPTGPVRTSFGWHVILLRPWSEVSDSVVANIEASPGRTLFLGMVVAATVEVRPDLGRWSRAEFSVVAP